MHGQLPANPQRSIFPADSSDSKIRPSADIVDVGQIIDSSDSETGGWFAKLARKLWPQKTAAALEHLTRARERQCYRYVRGDAEPFASFLVKLLRSPDGGRVLDAIMYGCKQPWWRKYRTALVKLAADAARADIEAAGMQQLELEFK